ncbi:Helix-turn-helix protein (plasmid) [Cylindrospermum stagnale PCC 7417]|uniref:Helix-turn-helix protein n=1 Tax=Cylindrospermum stagnale PCC 7417 TaxID=56107 RepID=K9X977_9NOST|nr:helix-turn-helix transcriptional regulator [Cylindrospermum stagnale]AFZ28217.1 Helix-turn-helix protein [Cylindrospermum stagnale PCC 7417]
MQERQKQLAQLIEQLLQEGWTQKRLAEKIGVDSTTVYRWLKAKVIPEADSKNFLRLAKLSGGDSESLQQYLDGYISLSTYRQGWENSPLNYAQNFKNRPVEEIKEEVLAQITLLEPADILDVISRSADFLAAKTA